ncbi:hypothetical protein C0993_004192 [Termitomyces sp. T159_Od127]|nr:hypothetical protein C0993_004192 [Termitomyces sp. T159_Od127]
MEPRPAHALVAHQTYASIAAQPPPTRPVEEYAHPAQVNSITERLLAWLEAAGQPVLVATLFLQDDLAVVMIEGLLNQIKLMKKQHVLALEQIDCASKHKVGGWDEPTTEPKRARLQVQLLHPAVEVVEAKGPNGSATGMSGTSSSKAVPSKIASD